MKDVMDFLPAALPWICIGLLLAVFFAKEARKKKDSKKKKEKRKLRHRRNGLGNVLRRGNRHGVRQQYRHRTFARNAGRIGHRFLYREKEER